MVVYGDSPTMGQGNCKFQAPKGRDVRNKKGHLTRKTM